MLRTWVARPASSTSVVSRPVPSVSITVWWMRFRTSANWSFASGSDPLPVASRSCSDMVLLLPILEDLLRNLIAELAERLGRSRLGFGENDGRGGVDRLGNAAVGRDVDIGRAADDGLHVRWIQADLRVGAVEHDRHLVGVDVHQPERLHADLHVL